MVVAMQVCLYFVNLVLEDYENYNFWHTPDMVERRNMYPHRFPPIREPQLAPALAGTSVTAGSQAQEHSCMLSFKACAYPRAPCSQCVCQARYRDAQSSSFSFSCCKKSVLLCRVSVPGHLPLCALRCAGGAGHLGACHGQCNDAGHAVEQLRAHLEPDVSHACAAS